MPPKREAAVVKGRGRGKGRGGKTVKAAEAEPSTPGPSEERTAIDALKKADDGKKMSCKVDAVCPYAATGEVRMHFYRTSNLSYI